MRNARLVLVAVLVALFAATGAGATVSESGGTVVVGPNETVRGDLTATAGVVVIRGTVDGDLSAFTGTLLITGTVTGDVEAVAGSIQIDGRTGSVEATAGAITLGPTGVIDGDATLNGGAVLLDGRIAADTRVVARDLTIGPDAVLEGGLLYDADRVTLNGSITGPVRQADLDGMTIASDTSPLTTLAWFLVRLVVAAALIAAFPAFADRLRETVAGDPVRLGIYGLGALIAFPIFLLFLIFLLIGIPIAIMALFLAVPLVWVATLYAAYLLGTWVTDRVDLGDWRWTPLITGMALWLLVGLIPVLGVLAKALLTLPVLGAFTVFARDRLR